MRTKDNKKTRIGILFAAILIPLLTGVLSALLTMKDMQLYVLRNHPPLSPPAVLFPIVWTVLYLMMGIASYQIWTSDVSREKRNKALNIYYAQLAMNFFWSILFFIYDWYLFALIWLVIMWILVLICMIRFIRIKASAGLMMIPLLVWITFAGYLNAAWYIMSRTPMPIPR